METKYFFQIKNKVHDASGIVNPDIWWWEKINGVYYPTVRLTTYEYGEMLENIVEPLRKLKEKYGDARIIFGFDN